MTARFQDWVTERKLVKREIRRKRNPSTHVNTLGEGRWMKIKLSQFGYERHRDAGGHWIHSTSPIF